MSIDVILPGMLIDVRLLQYSKVLSLMVLIPSGRVTVDKLLQNLNALLSISITLAGIETVFKLLQLLNAE